MSSETPTSPSSLTSSKLTSQVEVSLTISRSLTHTSILTEQGANDLLINHTWNTALLLLLIPQPLPLITNAWNCSDYFCRGCYHWGPSHTQPNCPTEKAAKVEEQKAWDKFLNRNNDWGKHKGAPWVSVDPQPTWMWTRVSTIPNEEWTKPRGHWYHLSLLISALHPSSSFPFFSPLSYQWVWELVLWFCFFSPPFLESMLVTFKVKWGVMLQTLFLNINTQDLHIPKT